ncbi:IS4 family transposase ISCku3 [subsurface metagenome]
MISGNENWEVLKSLIPENWEIQARELGALQRARKIQNADDLLRILLIHLADGCSLRETVTRAYEGEIADISDVALLKRLKASSEWFRWMSLGMLHRRGVATTAPKWIGKYKVKSVDASVVTEPGSTGSDWRLHYCLDLFELQCDQFMITEPDVGESFANFAISRNDLFIGDRAYGRLKGIKHVLDNGADCLVRIKNKAFNLYDRRNKKLDLLKRLKYLNHNQIGDWNITGRSRELGDVRIRLCAIKKSNEAAEKSIRKVRSELKKKQRTIDPNTLELHRFIILVTTLMDINAHNIMELYRARWQIEIAFKRLKSIMGFGHLPKVDIDSCRAWLHGKLFVALLAQAIVDEGRFFSPWGYPLRK